MYPVQIYDEEIEKAVREFNPHANEEMLRYLAGTYRSCIYFTDEDTATMFVFDPTPPVVEKIEIDVCENCGDIIVKERELWGHYRGPGSRLMQCQHTAIGRVAWPAHNGLYFMVNLEMGE